MANRIKGITVEIGGDTTKLSKALEGVNKNIKNTQTQLKDVEKLLKLDPTNTELLSQKQKLLADAVSSTTGKLETLKKASEQAAGTKDNYDAWKAKYDPIKQKIGETEAKLKDLKEQSKIADEQLSKGEISQEKYDALQREIKDTSDELASLKQSAKAVSDEFGNPISPEQYDSLQREIIETEQDLQRLQREAENSKIALEKIGEAGALMEKAGDKISGAGKKLLPITAGVSALGTTAAVKFADVDKTMQLTNATMKNSEEQANLLDKAMKDAASNSTFGMSDAATATLNFARAGLTAEQAASALAPAMNLAAGEGGSLDTVSAGLVATINGFHGSFDDAANSLKTGLARLVSPAKEGAAMMNQLGISVTESDGSMKDSITIQKELNAAFSKLSESEQIAAASAIFGKNQMAPWLALINTAPTDVETLSGSINNCAGTTDEMSQAMMSGFGGSIEQLKSSIDVLLTSLGQLLADYLTPIIAKIQEWVTKFNALNDGTKQTIIKIALIAAALGPLLIVIGKTISTVGMLMKFVSNIPTLIASAKTAFAALSGAIGSISAPVVAVVAVIAALIAAFVHLWNTNEDFKNSILSIWEQIKATFERLTSGIVGRLNDLGFNFEDFSDVVKTVWQGLCDILAPWFEGVFTYIAEIFDVVVDTILGILDIFIGLFTGDWEQMWNGVKGIFVGIWDFIKNSFTNIINTLKGIADVFLGWFGTSWNEMWTAIKDFFIGIWNNICAAFTSVRDFSVNTWNAISTFFTGIITTIYNTAVTIFTSVYNFFAGILTSIHDFFSTIFNAIWTVISTVCTTIYNTISSIWNAIYEFISPLLESVKYLFETIFEAIHIIISNVMDWISERIQAIWNGIVEFITPLLEGIKNFFQTIWNAISTAISTALSAISNTISSVWNAISGFISGIMNTIKSVFSSIWNAISGAISSVVNGIKSTISSVWNSISTTISSVMNTIKSTVTSIWDNVKSAVSNTIGGIYDTIKGGFDKAVNFVKGLASDAFSWGSDIISGIVDGIRSCINWISDACTDIADTIRSYLHFSVPDVGPLTEYESWMPDFMQGLADGIIKSKKVVAKAVSGVADTMKLSLGTELKYKLDGMTGAIMNGSAESSVINNYYNNHNSRTVNQTNNSPKALSRLEIYRQTRNALNT